MDGLKTEAREPRTLVEVAFDAYRRWNYPDQYLVKRDGAWTPVSGDATRRRAEAIAAGLRGLGVARGDRVALISPSRYEWFLVDLALQINAAVVVPVYPTLSEQQTGFILRDSGARIAVVADASHVARMRAVGAPELATVVSIDAVPGALSLADLEASGGPPAYALPEPDDLATLMYTSGTTGEPKGVMLSHQNIVANVLQCSGRFPFMAGGLLLSFLPLAHIFERMASYFLINAGARIAFAQSIERLSDDLREVKPDYLTAVPRVLEKVASGLKVRLAAMPPPLRHLVLWAVAGAENGARARLERRAIGATARLRWALAEALVFKKLRANLGGRLSHIITGGAATPEALTVLFEAAGVHVLPGYGLSESSPVIAVNVPQHFRLGSVGKPVDGVEVRIAEDGEILARGANIMRGYWRNHGATAETVTGDGWLKTGDVGRLDDDGFLYVTDRKKDLIVTAGGKKVAPQPLEQQLVDDPYIEQVMLVGDGRPYIVALITPAMAPLEAWAREHGVSAAGDRVGFLARPEVRALYKERIERVNAGLSRFETVKRFALLDRDLSQTADALTPTLKLRRRVVEASYRELIESLYSGGAPSTSEP